MIVVVGGGIFGLCVLDALTAAGQPARLYEKGALASGATGASGGMVRVWHLDPWMRRHARNSLPFWQDLPGYHRTGSLYFDRRPDELEGLEWLSPEEGSERFAMFAWGQEGAVYEPEAGWVDARIACQALAERALAGGAEIVEGCAVDEVLSDGVRVGNERIPAQAVVWAGGPDSTLNLAAPPSQNRYIQVLHLEPQSIPCFLDRPARGFGRPGAIGMGLESPACDALAQPVDQEDARRALETVARRWPACLEAQVTGGVRTPDRYLPDRRALFGRASERVYWAWGGSGAGFKLAPSLAREVGSPGTELEFAL